MRSATIRTLDDGQTQLAPQEIRRLRSALGGQLLGPGDPGYDEARSLWNGMIERRPALVARCRSAADVSHAVRFAREHRALVSVRGGGHNIAGNACCEGGLMLDLSPMSRVWVDPLGRSARVEPGCRLADMDRATQAFGLATPLGINSTTGVAGLTLGGGFGWLSRKHGMTVDNLLAAEVVTAEGERLRASERENADLFWGIRGGGGNFGVVTQFEFRLHPVGPEVLAGLIVHPLHDAPAVLRRYREFSAGLPDETAVWMVLRKAPPAPFIPEQWHNREVLVLAAFHAGDLREGERILQPLREFGNPIADLVSPQPYAQWQQTLDPLLTPGARNYWKSHDFRGLSDGLIEVLLDFAGRLPSPETEIAMAQLGGAVGRVAPGDTAYPHREAALVMNVHGRWQSPADDDRCIAWTRDLYRATARFATGGVYVNFLTQDESERVRAAYGDNYDRLVQLKTRFDPYNLFRVNQNVRPAGPARGPEPPTPMPG